jgi:hypothetical protein
VESGTTTPESEAADQVELDAKRFNTMVVLIALGVLGGFLYVIYRAIDSMRKAADEAEGVLGIFAPPRRKSQRKSRAKPLRTRR